MKAALWRSMARPARISGPYKGTGAGAVGFWQTWARFAGWRPSTRGCGSNRDGQPNQVAGPCGRAGAAGLSDGQPAGATERAQRPQHRSPAGAAAKLTSKK